MPGAFHDKILGGAIIVRSKQLFIDDYIIEDLTGLEKVLNQPVKHGGNPILGVDDHLNLYVAVLHDKEDNVFKMWYELWYGSGLCYATSADGVLWTKPIVNKTDSNSLLSVPKEWGFIGGAGIFKDPLDPNPERRYKMLYVAK